MKEKFIEPLQEAAELIASGERHTICVAFNSSLSKVVKKLNNRNFESVKSTVHSKLDKLTHR